MSAHREPAFFPQADAGGGAASGQFIPPAPLSRSNHETRTGGDTAAGANGMRVAEGENQRGIMASLFARVTGTGPARVGKPEQTDTEATRPHARVGTMNADERLPSSQAEDDLLDIPAFLRRQAN
jgi:cell division protein FtsZ